MLTGLAVICIVSPVSKKPNKEKIVNVATEKQMYWIKRMSSEVIVPEGLIRETVNMVLIGRAPERSHASAALDYMFKAPKVVKATTEMPVDPGMYCVDGIIYRVVKGRQSGNIYAKRLDGSKEIGFTLVYVGKPSNHGITASHRMTVEAAKHWGVQMGTCCICAATLTDPKSIAAGIGPVCAKRV
jgi:hypothetical protein